AATGAQNLTPWPPSLRGKGEENVWAVPPPLRVGEGDRGRGLQAAGKHTHSKFRHYPSIRAATRRAGPNIPRIVPADRISCVELFENNPGMRERSGGIRRAKLVVQIACAKRSRNTR